MSKSKKQSKAKPKGTRTPMDWGKLKKLWDAGATYEQMAKATDAHYDPEKQDATKATRAKIWKARHVGVRIAGKLVRFGARGKQPVKNTPKKASKKSGSGQEKPAQPKPTTMESTTQTTE